MKKILLCIYLFGSIALGQIIDGPVRIRTPDISIKRGKKGPPRAPKGMQVLLAPKRSQPIGPPLFLAPIGPIKNNQKLDTDQGSGAPGVDSDSLSPLPPGITEGLNNSLPGTSKTASIPTQTIENNIDNPIAGLQETNIGEAQSTDSKLTAIIISVSIFSAALAIAGIYFGLPHYKQWRKSRRFRTFDSVPNWDQIQVERKRNEMNQYYQTFN